MKKSIFTHEKYHKADNGKRGILALIIMVFTAIGAAAFAANEVYNVVKKATKKEKNGTSN